MNPEAKAMISDGRVLVLNSAMSVEIAILAHGVEAGREKMRNFAKRNNAVSDFNPHLSRPVMIPSPGDRIAHALAIVRVIGRAAGEEAYRLDYDGEYGALFCAFRDGLTSEENTKESADGTLQDIFRECGKWADRFVSCVLPSDFEVTITRDGAASLIDTIIDAFAGGVMEKLT